MDIWNVTVIIYFHIYYHKETRVLACFSSYHNAMVSSDPCVADLNDMTHVFREQNIINSIQL